MNYIEIVNDAIQYIESNLHRKLCLEELASRYYISPMHFYRIFRAVTNKTLKSYILGRKLSESAIALKKTDSKVVDIAFQYGFNSHELFTRNFLKMFHVTPSYYRKENVSVLLVERAEIVERDFRNQNKDIIVDYFCQEIKEIKLLGKEIIFCPILSFELKEVTNKVFEFAKEYITQGTARQLFLIIRRDLSDSSRIFCFYGIAAEEHLGECSGLAERIIPESKYAIFRYPGGMRIISNTVMKDLYKWISVSGFELNNNVGIDMFELFPMEYTQTGKFYLYVPVL